MAIYLTSDLVCEKCGNTGQLSIETNSSGIWDYALLGFSGTVQREGTNTRSLECFRCGATQARVLDEFRDHSLGAIADQPE